MIRTGRFFHNTRINEGAMIMGQAGFATQQQLDERAEFQDIFKKTYSNKKTLIKEFEIWSKCELISGDVLRDVTISIWKDDNKYLYRADGGYARYEGSDYHMRYYAFKNKFIVNYSREKEEKRSSK
jgi:hypothetical protein